MRKLAIALAISLLPIFAVPAEAAVCTYKSRQYKDKSSQAYTKYVYKTKRVCR
jgi:hypothetical protein